MPHEHRESTVQHLQTLFDVGVVAGLSDGQLLDQFTRHHGESAEIAFAALFDRHGGMVLRVCRGIVGNGHDAQDALQATFIILARSASRLWVRDSIAPWLHQVARRCAGRLKKLIDRQRAIERRAAQVAPITDNDQPRAEWAEALHEEIDRLPRCFRLPIVLCDLEGHSYEAAARYLDCPPGTIKSRLARGRNRLRGQLARRGISPAGGSSESPVPGITDTAAIYPWLTQAIIQGLTRPKPLTVQSGGVSVSVTTLAERVLQSMLLTRIKTAVLTAFAASALIAGVGLLATVASGTWEPSPQDSGGGKGVSKKVQPSAPNSKAASAVAAPSQPAVKSKSGSFAVPEPVITMEDSKRIWAYNPDKKSWHTYKAPRGVSISSMKMNSGRLVALTMEGQPIEEIAVFSAKAGKWCRQVLKEPSKFDRVDPTLLDNYAAYFINNRNVYVFSEITGKWSQQTLETTSKPPLIKFSFHSLLMIQDEAAIHAYSAITGTWETMKAERLDASTPRQGPAGAALIVVDGHLFSVDPRVGRFEEVKADEE